MIADCETCDRKQVPCSSCQQSQRAICFICQGDVPDPYCETSNVAALPVQTTTKSPFEVARRKLIASLLAIKAPAAYPTFPCPDDHEGIAAHLRETAAVFDTWLAAVGREVRDNAPSIISAGLFTGSFAGAIEGNETWACEEAGSELRAEYAARRRRA